MKFNNPSLALYSSVLALILGLTQHHSALADTSFESFSQDTAELTENVRLACPEQWEALESDMSELEIEPTLEAIWGGANSTLDKTDYISFLSGLDQPPAGTDEENLINVGTVIAHCAAQKLTLISVLYGNMPQDVLAAMSNINYEPGENLDGFKVGDIRETSRVESTPGWILLRGQTIGSKDSSADFKSDDLEELFELARYWKPNTGEEIWSNNEMVLLPEIGSGVGLNLAGQNALVEIEGSIVTRGSTAAIYKEVKYAYNVLDPLVYTPNVMVGEPHQAEGIKLWYDISDISTLFQDVEMTIPVTTSGDPVAVVLDKSGAGRNLVVAGGDSQRPIYTTNGGSAYLVFDGSNDVMDATVNLSIKSPNIFFFYNQVSKQANQGIFNFTQAGKSDSEGDSLLVTEKNSNGEQIVFSSSNASWSETGNWVNTGPYIDYLLEIRTDYDSNRIFVLEDTVLREDDTSINPITFDWEEFRVGARKDSSGNSYYYPTMRFFEFILYDNYFEVGGAEETALYNDHFNPKYGKSY